MFGKVNRRQPVLVLHSLTALILQVIGTPPLRNKPDLIKRSVLWREGASHAFTLFAAKYLCPFWRGVLYSECPLKEGPLKTSIINNIYSHPCILRPSLQPEKYGLELEVVLKWRYIYIENIRMVSLIDGLKMEGIVKWRGLISQGPL